MDGRSAEKQELQDSLPLQRLRAGLPDWSFHSAVNESGVDVVARTGSGEQVLIVIKSLQSRRVRELLGQAAIGILELEKHKAQDGHAMVVLAAKRAGKRAINRLEEFMQQHAPHVGWAVVEERGGSVVRLPELEIDIRDVGRRQMSIAQSAVLSGNSERALYSDLRRWMLKILLLHDVKEKLWGGPWGLPESGAELARLAGVSPPTAYDFIEDFKAKGLVSTQTDRIRVVNRHRAFEHWYRHEQTSRRVERIPVKGLFGRADLDALPEKAQKLFVVGGFEACQRLEVLHSSSRLPELHVLSDAASFVEAAELEVCDEARADLYLIPAKFPESIARGAVAQDGSPTTVDILQAALDMAFHPARGREQAEYIVEDVLGWLE